MSSADETTGLPRWIESSPDGAILVLRAVPRSSRTGAAVTAEELRLRLAAPPVEGEANAELVRFLSKLFRLPKSDVVILSGARGRNKRVLLAGVSADSVEEVLRRSG